MGKLVYVRMNVVEAVEMSRREYCEKRGMEEYPDEKLDERVMMVRYADGYISMCPKDRFFDVSVECNDGCCTFGYAITECRYHGKRIKRIGWNGDGQFVRYETIGILADAQPNENGISPTSDCFVFHFKNRKTGESGVQVGWLASQADMAANDWVVID